MGPWPWALSSRCPVASDMTSMGLCPYVWKETENLTGCCWSHVEAPLMSEPGQAVVSFMYVYLSRCAAFFLFHLSGQMLVPHL
jgi:hypothetical protein